MTLFSKKQSVAFSDILRGLQQAINSAQEILQNQQVRNLQQFIGNDGKPVTHKVKIGEKVMEVPLITLVPRNHLMMEDVEIKFKTKVGDMYAEEPPILMGLQNVQSAPEISYANLQMQMDRISMEDKNLMEITVRFKAKDIPEGMARVIDEYNKQIY